VIVALVAAAAAVSAFAAAAGATTANFESPHVHPLALTPDGTRLLAVNTPDARLSVFDITSGEPHLLLEIPVGLEPVSVAAESDTHAWVVNHVSDSVSRVDLVTGNVVRTFATGDEPADVVFASGKAFVSVSQRDQVLIYDLANLDAAPVTVPLAGSDPQALARNLSGTRVYVAVFESGNRTSIASVDDVRAHGGLPPPNPAGRPDVGLILQWTDGVWRAENGVGYADTHAFTLADHDLAVLDATVAVPVPSYADGLGTLMHNVAVHPTSGDVWAPHTELLNGTRFEPLVRGRFARTRLAIVPAALPATGTIRDLNPHIRYDLPGSPAEIAQSLSQPGGIVFEAGGGTAYMPALGSDLIAVLDSQGQVVDRITVAGGPTGVVLDAARRRLYVSRRFDNALAVVDVDARVVLRTTAIGWDPSPASVRNGRRFLYDARFSAHGDVACATCHAQGASDGLSWDLGDPAGSVLPPPPNQVDPLLQGFHPMKGPMVTQSLRGLAGTGPLHWRGDRADFNAFNPAFVSLLGGMQELPGTDMQAFTDFVLGIRYPPNPNQNLDRTYPNPAFGPSAERGRVAFTTQQLDGPFRCSDCHALPTGTNGLLVSGIALQETQDFKIPHLRNLYEKTGFDRAPGSHKRGFGFLHDGSIATLFDFLRLPLFDFGTDDPLRRDVEAFLLAFDTGTAPAVGAQRTIDAANRNHPVTIGWLDLMIAQDAAANCEVIVKGRLAGQARGFVYDGNGTFRSDRAGEPPLTPAALRALAAAGSELTVTGVPPGSGVRMGIDRDSDGYLDRSELDAGADPADPLSTPVTVSVGADDAARLPQLAHYPNPATAAGTTIAFDLPARENVQLRIYDARGRLVRTLANEPLGPGPVRLQWDGTDDHGRRVASARYFYRLQTAAGSRSRAVLVVR
jgi:DNA-binding beta-propeller fold protein YncE